MKKISFEEYVMNGVNMFSVSDREIARVIKELSEEIEYPRTIKKLKIFFDKTYQYETAPPN